MTSPNFRFGAAGTGIYPFAMGWVLFFDGDCAFCSASVRQVVHYDKHGRVNFAPLQGKLAKEKGLGIAKASKLAAAFELGCRVAREELREVPLDTPELIHDYFGPQLRHLSQEQVVVATLDARLRHVGTIIAAVGTVSDASAHPREILRPVITRGAYGFVLIHNHPSGDPTPSRADEIITRRLVEAATLMQVCFLDHVIVGRPSPGRSAYYSFREAGIVP